jgi:hypothetical protein
LLIELWRHHRTFLIERGASASREAKDTISEERAQAFSYEGQYRKKRSQCTGDQHLFANRGNRLPAGFAPQFQNMHFKLKQASTTLVARHAEIVYAFQGATSTVTIAISYNPLEKRTGLV